MSVVSSSRISLKDWQKGDQNILAWTVNKKKDKDYFEKRDIPFFTDSAIEETPEAWVPPQRRVTWSYLTQRHSWTMLLVVIIVPSLFYWSFAAS